MRKFLIVVIAIAAIVIIAAATAIAVISLDLFSYGATGSEVLNPTGSMGRALAVYDPSVSGGALLAIGEAPLTLLFGTVSVFCDVLDGAVARRHGEKQPEVCGGVARLAPKTLHLFIALCI